MWSEYLLAPNVKAIHGTLLCGGNHLIHHQYIPFHFICKIILNSIPDGAIRSCSNQCHHFPARELTGWSSVCVCVFIDAAEWGGSCVGMERATGVTGEVAVCKPRWWFTSHAPCSTQADDEGACAHTQACGVCLGCLLLPQYTCCTIFDRDLRFFCPTEKCLWFWLHFQRTTISHSWPLFVFICWHDVHPTPLKFLVEGRLQFQLYSHEWQAHTTGLLTWFWHQRLLPHQFSSQSVLWKCMKKTSLISVLNLKDNRRTQLNTFDLVRLGHKVELHVGHGPQWHIFVLSFSLFVWANTTSFSLCH